MASNSVNSAICNAQQNFTGTGLQDRDALKGPLEEIKRLLKEVSDAYEEDRHNEMNDKFYCIAETLNNIGPKPAAELMRYCAIFREKLNEIIKAHQSNLNSVNRILKEMVSKKNDNLMSSKVLTPKNIEKIAEALDPQPQDLDSNFGSDDENSDYNDTEQTGTHHMQTDTDQDTK